MIEISWTGICLAAFVFTVSNLFEAARAREAVRGKGTAHETQAWGNVLTQRLLLVSIAACACLVIPALYRPGDTAVSPIVIVAMALPISLALNSYFIKRNRDDVRLAVAQEVETRIAAAETLATERHDELTATVDATAEQVAELHEGTAPERTGEVT